jgi:hypothetical protein
MGHFGRYNAMIKRVRKKGHLEILAVGGSITAGGYFQEFARSILEKSNLTVNVHNHGHGATEITCKQCRKTPDSCNNVNVLRDVQDYS